MDSQHTQDLSQNDHGSLYLLKIKSDFYKPKNKKWHCRIFPSLLIIFNYYITFFEWPNIWPLEYMFSNFSMPQNHLEGLLKHYLLIPTSRASDSVCLGWGPRICHVNHAHRWCHWNHSGNHTLRTSSWRARAKLFQIHVSVQDFTVIYTKSFDFLRIRWQKLHIMVNNSDQNSHDIFKQMLFWNKNIILELLYWENV